MITTMSNKTETTSLSFRQSPFSAAVITVLSLFSQFMNWFAFEKLDYPWWVTLITPLLLCAMYHFVQLDAGGKNGYSRIFFYVFSAAVPLLLGIFLTLAVYLGDPDLSTFNYEAEYTGTPRELISLYSGRIAITSLYVTVFAAMDIPVLKMCDKARKSR